jgi:alkylation response protein AidB-like acyl-CoA dehydrogenase
VDFGLSAEAEALRGEIRKFAQKELRDDMIERDASSTFWREGWQKCADMGILGLPIPEAYGGAGSDLTTTIAVMEALGYGCSDLGLLFSINAHLWTGSIPILRFGTEEQKQRYLPGLSDGRLIAANGASEPGAGSDVFGMKMRAERDGEDYVLNGQKTFCTNAQIADVFAVYAATNPKLGHMGITGFLIEKGTPGMTVGKPIHKMGLRTSPMGELFFENCRVPARNLLGKEGGGAAAFNCSMEWERGCILAMHVGRMERQIERCVEHARQRVQSGHPIGRYQAVAHRIANMKIRLEAARPLVYKIGWKIDNRKSAMMEAAIAKVFLSESAVESSLDAIQTFGGYGYTTEYELERDLRDSVGSRIYSGTTDIQRNIIARLLGLPPNSA